MTEQIKRTYTREELHELVWTTPMQKLAAEFGLSDKGLAKTCARHLVPVPPRGYWARIAAGQSIKKTPLRNVENKHLHTVHVGAAKERYLSDTVLTAVTASRFEAIAGRAERRKVSADGATVTLEEPGDSPHRLIASLARQLRKAKATADGVVTAPGVAVHERNRDRAIFILHNLARLCDARGDDLSANENGRLVLRSVGGSGTIGLSEERKREKHIPTAAERAEHEKIVAKRRRDSARGLWSFGRTEPWSEFDIIYTGKLTLACDSGTADGIRKSWSDGKTQRVEHMLDAFIDGIKINIAAEGERRRIYAEKQRNWQILQRRQYLAEQRAKREEKRLAYLDWIAKIRREVDDLRATIEAVPREANLPPDYQRMIAWAESHLGDLEAQTTVEQIQASLVEQELYVDPDPLFDPEGDPPPETDYWGY